MSDQPTVVLAGFMGTGKSTVARELAALLGRPAVDLDQAIAREAGCSIPELFAREGEAGFRARERQAVRGIAGQQGLVVATGGGTLLDPDNRSALLAGAHGVLLVARPEVLAARLAPDCDARPLLAGAGDAAGLARRVASLLVARADRYAGLDHVVDTSDLDPGAVAARIAASLPLRHVATTIAVPGAEGLPALAAFFF